MTVKHTLVSSDMRVFALGSLMELHKGQEARTRCKVIYPFRSYQRYSLELMMALFTIVQGLISTIINAAGLGSASETVLPQEIVDAIEDCGFFESIPL